MKTRLLPFGPGVLIGVVYGLIVAHSPAPPLGALTRLLGILPGEQVIPVVKSVMAGHSLPRAIFRPGCAQHLSGCQGHGGALRDAA